MAIKLSNVIGAPFNDDVLRQLAIRARRNSTVSRSDEEVLFLANKTGWARLTSSVDIILSGNERKNFFSRLNLDPGDYQNPNSLAQNWILEAGTSIQKGNGISLRKGIGLNGAYGLGGTEELGFRPIPGLVSVQVETTGRLGSLRQATISLKVWNMNQLNAIEALYFRLGYSMLLEWGHSQYFSNKDSNNSQIPTGIFVSNDIYGIDNPFSEGRTKETVQQDIARKSKRTSGNYDGMLGIVSNFNWAFNQDGGYDCTLRLIGLGAIMDSVRINQSYTLPDGQIKKFKEQQNALAELTKTVAALVTQTAADTQDDNNLESLPGNSTQLWEIVKKYSGPSNLSFEQFILDYRAIEISSFNSSNTATYSDAQFVDLKKPAAGINLGKLEAANLKFGGLWISRGNVYYNINTVTPTLITFNLNGGGSISNFLDNFPNLARINERISNAAEDQIAPEVPLVKLFQDASSFYVLGSQVLDLNLDDILTTSLRGNKEDNKAGLFIKYPVELGATGIKKEIFFNLRAEIPRPEPNFPVSRRLALEALAKWALNDRSATVSSVEATSGGLVKIEGFFQISIPVTVRNRTTPVQINWYFETNNPGFILSSAESSQTQQPTSQPAQEPNSGDTAGQVNQPDTEQIDSAEGFQSALHAMLAIVQSESQVIAAGEKLEKPVIQADISTITQDFYKAGIFDKVFDTSVNKIIPGSRFDITQYAKRGFNSDLLAYPDDKVVEGGFLDGLTIIPDVDFKALSKAYVVRYPKQAPDGSLDTVRLPVYLQFGYLLAFLNNMCLIYDSKLQTSTFQEAAGTEKRPYIYIDFNPETNFCLSSPQQMSIDPNICLIPFNSSDTDYKSLFGEGIKTNGFFDPENQNIITAALNSYKLFYKSLSNPYQGKIMNILLNVDYLLRLVREYAGADKEHAVNLQPFLERIVADVNKSLGNINTLRVAYRDDANVVQIVDDQWVPNLQGEKSLIDRQKYLDTLNQAKDPILSGQLPVFEAPSLGLDQPNGTFSLARDFQFRTTMSTKLASMIAISAQAATGSINAKDHSSLSYLNRNFQDRYKPIIQDPSNKNKGTNNNDTSKVNQASNDQKAADTFNAHVASIYSNAQLAEDRIEMAKNYYIERMSKVKSSDITTTAAPFIPADLEIEIDGISGIIMGNAFTIPESRLPLSLRAEDGYTKVGFIVTGLSHTVDSNQWLTKIKGQMIKLRDDSLLRTFTTFALKKKQSEYAAPASAGNSVVEKIRTTPWSAGFISYVMKQAGVSFPFNAQHTVYAQSLRNSSRSFEILNPATNIVKAGDIIVANRDNNLTFNTNPWSGSSHGDIVVSVSGNSASGVGGNLSETVSKYSIPLIDGKLQTGTAQNPKFFVILRPPASLVQAIISKANEEYKLWSDNKWKETTASAIPRLRQYYGTIGITI